jgi:beta-aspartyl-peptidase (threonine type)
VARAAAAGWRLLEGGASALDAVEEAVRVLEADPEFNAGYGSVLNRLGHVEVDAAVMVASDPSRAAQIGAVGAVPWMRHPVTLARRVLEESEHAFLVGGGALLFAKEKGLAADPPDTMIAPRHRKEPGNDTVGACAVDRSGRLAAATSTGGTTGKRAGRVGDSPLPGAGLWADSGVAVSTTGHGESILRVLLARDVADRLRGTAPDEAAAAAVRDLVARTGGEAGLVLVTATGQLAHATSTAAMPWASIDPSGEKRGIRS